MNLLPEHVERIYTWYRDYADVEGVARVVTLEEIATNDYILNIPRYVEPKAEQEVLTVEEAMQRLRQSAEAGVRGRGEAHRYSKAGRPPGLRDSNAFAIYQWWHRHLFLGSQVVNSGNPISTPSLSLATFTLRYHSRCRVGIAHHK